MYERNKTLRIFFLITGTVALTFSGINWNNGFAAWIAPLFLLLYTRKSNWLGFVAFFLVISVAGGISQTSNNLLHLPEVNVFNGIVYGVLTTIPYLIDRIIYRNKSAFYYTFLFPASVVLVEYMASFAIGTWGSVAHTQYGFKAFLQLGSITGIYGIWFLISWFATGLIWFFENRINRRLVSHSAIVFCILFIAVILYGGVRLKIEDSGTGEVKVAAVLSDIDISRQMAAFTELAKAEDKTVPAGLFSDSLEIDVLLNRTRIAACKGAKIIVWNEVALSVSEVQKHFILAEVKEICTNNQVYILVSFIEACTDAGSKPLNNISLLITPKGEIVWEYHKSFLQPTAEAPIVNAGDFILPVYQTEYGKIGSVICSDLDMQHYIKQAGEKAVDILLVSASDWEEITPLHSRMAVIQAIQFGCNIVRANGKGVSAVYNYKGIEMASLNSLQSNKKILYATLPLKSVRTIYSKLGDVLPVLSILFLLFMIMKRWMKR